MTATDTTASTLLVAIDISKHRHEVLIGVPGKTRRRRLTILNTLEDFQRLSAILASYELPVRIGFEATGNYHRPLAHHLGQARFELKLVSSVGLARTREALHNSWDKNDPKDAQVILHMLKIGAVQFFHDPLATGTADIQELSKTHEIVTTVSANSLVELMDRFGKVTRTKIGSPNVIAAMEERLRTDAGKVAGYEPNGGFLLGWVITGPVNLPRLMTRDSTLPLVAMLASVKESGLSVSEYIARLPSRRTAADRLQNIPRDRALALVTAILEGDHAVLPDGLGKLVDTDRTDGVRMRFTSGRVVHIRPSGNAPELRCYVEAETTLREALSRLGTAV